MRVRFTLSDMDPDGRVNMIDNSVPGGKVIETFNSEVVALVTARALNKFFQDRRFYLETYPKNGDCIVYDRAGKSGSLGPVSVFKSKDADLALKTCDELNNRYLGKL